MEINSILKKLHIDKTGKYEDQFFIIELEDSDEYSRVYTKLNDNAVNTEYPNFGTNTVNTTIKATHYFEIDDDNKTYNIFLIADFENDNYYLKIGEK